MKRSHHVACDALDHDTGHKKKSKGSASEVLIQPVSVAGGFLCVANRRRLSQNIVTAVHAARPPLSPAVGSRAKVEIVDVTSRGSLPFVALSPFYDHGGIPVPFVVPATTSRTVEGIWQGLKLVDGVGKPDQERFARTTRLKLQRGKKVKGHFGGDGQSTLGYGEARRQIYVPAYTEMLRRPAAQAALNAIVALVRSGASVVLLDYATRDVEDLSGPLSHALLVHKRVVELLEEDNKCNKAGVQGRKDVCV